MINSSKVNVKSSSTKSSLNNDNITIDAKHSDMVNYFKNLQDSIPLLKEELKKIVLEYNNKDSSRKNDIEYILYRDSLKEKINEIKYKINKISNNDELNKYFLDVGILLNGYYENIENIKTIDNNLENFEDNLLNYDGNELDEDIYDEDEENIIEDSVKKNKGKDSDKKENYKSVLNFFNNREKIDPGYVAKIKIDLNICKCPVCKTEMILYPSDGIQICENCGIQQNILIESDKPSFKDPPLEVCYFSYKRINHYNEYLGHKIFNELVTLLIY
jgi:hypothetical protein